MMHRTIVHAKKLASGSAPLTIDEEVNNQVEVEVTVKYLPYGENELIGHYLLNQVLREALEKLDRNGLSRVLAETQGQGVSV